MFPPNKVVAFDFETVEDMPDGSSVASLDVHKAEFRVTSCAFAWDGGTYYADTAAGITAALTRLALSGNPVICHNQQFEYGVMLSKYPSIKLNWHADSMRLCQLYDNGGDKFYLPPPEEDDEDDGEEPQVKRNPTHGLRLMSCVKRILCDDTDHKEAAYAAIRARGVQAGKEGANLHLLTRPEMEAYNVADAVQSLRLYKFITTEFKVQEYDWATDNMLFQFMLDKMVRAQLRGVVVDRAAAGVAAAGISSEIEVIKKSFADMMAAPIKTVERMLLTKRLAKFKTELGARKYQERGDWREECKFNPGSSQQLTMLFVDVLGMTAKFCTKKGAPSFKASFLHQWGEGGLALQKLKKRGIVLSQIESLRALSEYDGLWHLSIKLCGTSTGRMAGGSHE